MKLILFTSILSGGGAERVLCQLANSFSKEHQVILAAAYPSENEYSICERVKKVYLDSSTETKNPVRQIAMLRRMIKTEKPDVCISFLPQPNFKLIIASLGLKKKVLISVRNDPAREYAGGLTRLLAKILYSAASGVVFQTKDAQSWFPERIIRKSRVIMNQVDPVFFQRELEDPEYYVATGRLNQQKNYPMMFKAFARFLEKHPDQKLFVYGTGVLADELQQLIASLGVQDGIILKGASNSIPDILAKAKVFLLSSDFEGMPNGLLEAVAMGLPCISTDCPCGGPREIIENGVSGMLIKVGDETAMFEALCRIEENDEYRAYIAKKARETAKRYHPDVVYGQWLEYITALVQGEC